MLRHSQSVIAAFQRQTMSASAQYERCFTHLLGLFYFPINWTLGFILFPHFWKTLAFMSSVFHHELPNSHPSILRRYFLIQMKRVMHLIGSCKNNRMIADLLIAN